MEDIFQFRSVFTQTFFKCS